MIEKCWSQEPQYRPDLSQVISCLQALALLRDRVNNDQEGNEPSRSGQDRKFSIGGEAFTLFPETDSSP